MKVRLGHGANCSSIGAVVDTLFASAVVGTMIFAAVSAAMAKEEVTIIGKNKGKSERPRTDRPESENKESDEADT
jgi:hypothetical protein